MALTAVLVLPMGAQQIGGIPADNDAQSRSRQVVRSRMHEIDRILNAATPEKKRFLKKDKNPPAAQVEAAIIDQVARKKAYEAMSAKLIELNNQASSNAVVTAKTNTFDLNDPRQAAAALAAAGWVKTLPEAKARKLDALTERYRNDEITPREYHQARARIIQEP